MNKITKEDFLILFNEAKIRYNSTHEPLPELKSDSLDKIKFAINAPFQTGYGQELYETFEDKASILFYLINKGHYLANGNKRMAYFCLQYFCVINNKSLNLTNDEAYIFSLKVANSKESDGEKTLDYINNFISKHLKDNNGIYGNPIYKLIFGV